jgi:hypothetical protein
MTRLYLIMGGALLFLASNIGSYFYGVVAGRDHVRAAMVKPLKRAAEQLHRAQGRIGEARLVIAREESERRQTAREIYVEIPKIIAADPVYRNRCVNDDGVRLLDRAADNANGRHTGGSAAGSGGAAEAAADGRPDGQGQH